MASRQTEDRDTFSTAVWHVPLVIGVVGAFLLLPMELAACFAVFGALGWLAGSAIPRGRGHLS